MDLQEIMNHLKHNENLIHELCKIAAKENKIFDERKINNLSLPEELKLLYKRY